MHKYNPNRVSWVEHGLKGQEDIAEALDNLTMVTTSEKYVLTQINSTIKNQAETNKILMNKINTRQQQTNA